MMAVCSACGDALGSDPDCPAHGGHGAAMGEDPRWLDHPRGPWLITSLGARFYPLDPRPEDVDVRDVAHALGNVCRFGGHTRHHYSVAQHSVLVSRIVPPALALVGLMHDAPEAYVGDVIAPIKLSGRLGEYDRMERLVWAAVVDRFDLTAHGVDAATLAMPPEVKEADMIALVTEARDVMGIPDVGLAPGWPDLEPLATVTIEPVSPRDAAEGFVSRWNELTGGGIRTRSVFVRR